MLPFEEDCAVAEGYLFPSGNDGQVFGESSNIVDSCWSIREQG
jgi:hypothetical protein